ncbi:MAG: hypothetical protein WCW84_08835 [Sulfurimonas sp.]|jgi:hypothetical protein
MKTHYKIVLLGTLLIALSGCNTESLNLPTGYILPPMPDATENSKTIAGIDSNTNGVRDDVEIYIYSNYSKPEEQKALMQYAKMEQNALLAVKTKEDVSNIYYPEMSKAIECGFNVFKTATLVRDNTMQINAQALNTLERVKQDLEIRRLMAGGVYENIQKGDPCE